MPSPARKLVGKAARMAVILVLTSILIFTLVSLSPLDPITAYLGYDRMQISVEQQERIIKRWGLDRPPLERFAAWSGNVLRGDLGWSAVYDQPVAEVIRQRFAATFGVMFMAWVLSGLIGFSMGALAGTYRGSPWDNFVSLYSYVLASTPTFWMGMVLLMVLGVGLGWFPICCGGPLGLPPEEVGFGQRLYHMALPALTLAVIEVSQIALHTREKMIDVFQSDFALYAAAQGESRLGVAWRHGPRNVLLPAITLQFASVGELFGGSVLVEQVFSFPGLGKAAVEAGVRGDAPLLLGIGLFSAVFVVAGNVLADLLYLVVDPRIRLGEEAS
ncbi:MAG: ABC transporter permease [Pseudomonadota bacterium]